MSWLSDVFHGVENVASDIGSFWTHNASWLTPLAIGAGALAGGALLGPALFGGEALFGGAAAGAEEAGAGIGAAEAGAGGFGEGAAAIDAGIGGAAGAAAPGAVDISVTPFVEGAADIGAGGAGAAEAGAGGFLPEMAAAPFSGGTDVLAGGGPLDILGGQSAQDLALASAAPTTGEDLGSFTALAEDQAPEDLIAPTAGGTIDTSTAPIAVGETGGGLEGGTDVAAAQAENLGAGSTGAQVAAGEPLGAYPTETAREAFAAGRFGGMQVPDLGVAQQDALAGGLNPALGPLPPTDQAVAQAAALPTAQTIAEAPIAEAPPLGQGSELTTAGGPSGAGAPPPPANEPGGIVGAGRSLDTALSGAAKGVGGFLDNPLVKYGLPLGVMGGLMLKGPDKLPPQTAADLALANTQATFGATELTLARSGNVSAADQASLDIQRTNARNQAYQLFASRGGGDPSGNTDYQQTLQQIDAQIEAQKQTILNNMISNGLTAMGGASKSLQTAAALQVQNDTSFNASLTGALQSFGMIAAFSGARGGGGGGGTAPTAVGASSVNTT